MADTLNDRQKQIMKDVLYKMLVHASKAEGATEEDASIAAQVADTLSTEYVDIVDKALSEDPDGDIVGAATFTIG